MLIQAAMAAQGVALARGVLAADELAAGRLVRPFTLSLPTEYAYYLVCPVNTAEQPKIAAFRDWLLGEARRESSAA
jgi:LysR family glycine cleavage system transcriptional activator